MSNSRHKEYRNTSLICISPMCTRSFPSYTSSRSWRRLKNGPCRRTCLNTRILISIIHCRGHPHISPLHQATDSTTPSNSNRCRSFIPPLLLLSMFACAARHDSKTTPFPPDPSIMWPAGDEFLDSAKVLLNSTYASASPSTVQALLLMGYREGGIGDMSLSWTYVGMAIRMAQDLGMHRLADGWKRGGLGGRLFSEWELAERKRIWFGCVVLDKFVSAFIGKQLTFFTRNSHYFPFFRSSNHDFRM